MERHLHQPTVNRMSISGSPTSGLASSPISDDLILGIFQREIFTCHGQPTRPPLERRNTTASGGREAHLGRQRAAGVWDAAARLRDPAGIPQWITLPEHR